MSASGAVAMEARGPEILSPHKMPGETDTGTFKPVKKYSFGLRNF